MSSHEGYGDCCGVISAVDEEPEVVGGGPVTFDPAVASGGAGAAEEDDVRGGMNLRVFRSAHAARFPVVQGNQIGVA